MTIDLGVLSTERPVVRVPRRSPRRAVTIAVLVAVLLGLPGASSVASGSAPQALATIPVGDAAQLMITGTRALIVDKVNGPVNDGARITSYALPGGARQWSAPVAGVAGSATMLAGGSTVVAVLPMMDGDGAEAQAFDLRTGRVMWKQAVDSAVLTPAGIFETLPSGLRTDDVRVVDPETGMTRWTRVATAGCRMQLAAADPMRAVALIEACPAVIRRVDLTTGYVTAVSPFRFQPDPSGISSAPRITIAGNAVIVSRNSGEELSVVAFSAVNLKPLWSGVPTTSNATPEACGVELCIVKSNGVLQAFDPETGRPVDAPPTVVHGPELPAAQGVAGGPLTLIVVSATVGDLLSPYNLPIAPFWPAGTTIGFPPGFAMPVWISRPLRTGSTVTAVPVWRVNAVPGDCSVTGDYLACLTPPQQISIWRLPV